MATAEERKEGDSERQGIGRRNATPAAWRARDTDMHRDVLLCCAVLPVHAMMMRFQVIINRVRLPAT
jgi:hypothetical protein